MLLDRLGEVGSALDGRVVGDDQAFLAANSADAGNQSTGGDVVVAIHAVAGELADFEERRARVEQAIDTLARQQFAAAEVFFACALAAALRDGLRLSAQVVHQRQHRRAIFTELGTATADTGLENTHLPATSSRAMTMRWMSLVPS